MKLLLASVVIVMAACGGKADEPAHPATAAQSLTDATRMFCDAPNRAEADPKYKEAQDDLSKQINLLQAHLGDDVKNQEVLDFIARWKTLRALDKGKELGALVEKAQLPSCKLHEIYDGVDHNNEPAK